MQQEFVTDSLLDEQASTQVQDQVTDSVTQATEVDQESPEMEAEPTLFEQETDEASQPNEPIKELSEIDQLINRRTGFWQVDLELEDLKWVKNMCNSKFKFKGPNEAFMLMNCYLGFSAAVARAEDAAKNKMASDIVIQASAIEACALMLNKFEGSELKNAQSVFRVAIALNNIIMEMQALDAKISELKEAEQSNTSTEESNGVQ